MTLPAPTFNEHPLKGWRLENRLSQRRLAEILEVSDMAIGRWEREGALPERKAWQALIDFTGGAVTPNDWFTIHRVGARQKRRSNHGTKIKGRRRKG